MRILVGWDNPAEAELLKLYLTGGGENEVVATELAEDFLTQLGVAHERPWDVVLLALSFPHTVDQGFALFEQVEPPKRSLTGAVERIGLAVGERLTVGHHLSLGGVEGGQRIGRSHGCNI